MATDTERNEKMKLIRVKCKDLFGLGNKKIEQQESIKYEKELKTYSKELDKFINKYKSIFKKFSDKKLKEENFKGMFPHDALDNLKTLRELAFYGYNDI